MMTEDDDRRTRLVAVTTAMTVLGTLVVALRIFARGILIRQCGYDDWSMCIGWVFTLGYLIEVLIGVHNLGVGFSARTLSTDQIVEILKNSLAIEVTYYGCITFIKISILFFYLRIAATRFLFQACRATIAFIASLFVIEVMVCLAQCIPLKKEWDITGLVKGNCINTTAFFYSTSAIHIVLDLWILALPIKSLMTIQRSRKEKCALVFIFGAGIFSMVASLIRLYSIRIFTLSDDPTRDAVPVNLWSLVEVNVGIICASIPALKALTVLWNPERRSQISRGNAYYGKGHGIIGTAQTSIARASETYTMRSMFAGKDGNAGKEPGRDDESTRDILRSQDSAYAGSINHEPHGRAMEFDSEHGLGTKV